jgi:hypothetical protein
MKEDLRSNYGKTRVTETLVKTFLKDINSGKIVIDTDFEGTYKF